MNRERYQQVRAILEKVEAEPADRRADAIRSLCDDDTSLEREVQSLLTGIDRDTNFMATPALGDSFRVDSASDMTAPTIAPGARFPSPLPHHVGRYRITRMIAEGGMGSVFEAQQDQPERVVALKTLRPGLLRTESLRRFELEVRVLARLQHPAIAQIFDAGSARVAYQETEVDDSGPMVPFFAMELIRGQPITAHVAERSLTIEQRVHLMVEIAEAVHHGHQKGVIHRDLKPGNILVDEDGRPKIIDFGVARATDADVTLAASETREGQLIGTLRYMSPEQCTGNPEAVDLRSDVYSLGVVLFELLSGELPYREFSDSMYELPRIIRDTPARPLSGIDVNLRGDLETIVAKALEKEPDRRYQSASEFAADLRRYISREPIAARPPNALYQMRLFARRNRALVGGAIAATLLLIAGVIGTSIGMVRSIDAREDADEALGVADERRELAEFESYAANIAAAESAIRADRIAEAETRLLRTPEHLRGWEWRHLMARLDRSRHVLRGHTAGVSDVVFSSDGTLVGSAGSFDGTLRLWDAASGEPLLYLDLETNGYVRMAATPDDTIVAVGDSRGDDIRIHKVEDGSLVAVLRGHRSGIECLAVSPDGRFLASGSSDRTARIWSLESHRLLHTLTGHDQHVSAIVFSADGSKVLTGSWDQTAALWDTESGGMLRRITEHTGRVYTVAWSPDGSYYVTGADDNEVRVWDAETNDVMTVFRRHASEARSIAIRPDGLEIATAGGDSSIVRWDPFTGRVNGVMLGHRDAVRSLAWSRDSSMIASGSQDRTVRLWRAESTDVTHAQERHGWLFDVWPMRNGSEAIICGTNSILRRADLATGSPAFEFEQQRLPALGVALSPNEDIIVTGGDDRLLQVFDVATGECVARLPGHTSVIRDVDMHPDGALVASGSLDQSVRLWDVRRSAMLHVEVLDRPVYSVTFDPSGERLFAGLDNGEIVVFEIPTMKQLTRFKAHNGYARRLAFHPDGTVIATGGGDGTIAIWDARTLEERNRIQGHTMQVNGIAFSPDGSRLATGGNDQLVRLWDTKRLREVATLHGHNNIVFALAFSPDGRYLVSVGAANTTMIWESPPM